MPWTVFQTGDLPLEYAGPVELHVALQNAGHESCLLPSEGNWIHAGGGAPAERYLQGLDTGPPERHQAVAEAPRGDGQARAAGRRRRT